MTQQCKYDEQILDYVYGELSDTERKSFSEHLPGCSSCSAQVESFGHVRREFAQRPPVEPAGESMQRMRALLMQAAADYGQGAAADREAGGGGGGKVLPFRARSLRRVLLHPAGGIMAVAAAALFWVVFRTQPAMHTSEPAPAAPAAPAAVTASADTDKAAATPAPAPAIGSTPIPASDTKALQQAVETKPTALAAAAPAAAKPVPSAGATKDDDFGGLRARFKGAKDQKEVDSLNDALMAQNLVPKAPPISAGPRTSMPPATPAAGKAAPLKTVDSRLAARQNDYRQSNSASAVVAMADQAYEKKAKDKALLDSERGSGGFAQPPPAAEPAAAPPPPPPPVAAPAREAEDNSVQSAIARTQEQRKQKVVEELANQELAGLGGGQMAGAPAPPADDRAGQRHLGAASSASKADSAEHGRGMPTRDGDEAQAAATPAQAPGSLGRGPGAPGGADDGAAAVGAIKEQIRRGHCADADAALTRLERAFPATHGLAETRAEWQTTCAASPTKQQERRLPTATPDPAPSFAAPPPAPMVAPSAMHRSAPKASKKSYSPPTEMAAKPAPAPAPARAKGAKAPDRGAAKAADAVY